MPREIHRKSLDGTRWTSTSSAATLKAPYGGGTHGLGAACNCTGRKDLQGLSSCGCSAALAARLQRKAGLPARTWQKTLTDNGLLPNVLDGLEGLEGLGVYGKTQVEPLKQGERAKVTVRQVLFGQPTLGIAPVVEQTSKALLELGYKDVKIGSPTIYPLAWSWAWEAGPRVWTAYVSNASAGPFLQELDTEGSPYFTTSDTAPGPEVLRSYPTQGAVLSIEATPSTETLSLEAQGTLREALRRNIRPSLGTDVRTYLTVGGQKKPTKWLWAAAFFGSVAYAGKKLNDAR